MVSRTLAGCAGAGLGVLVGDVMQCGTGQLVEGEAEDGSGSGALLGVLGEDGARTRG